MLQRRSFLTGIGLTGIGGICGAPAAIGATAPTSGIPVITGAPDGVKTKGYPDGRAVLWRGEIWSAAGKNPPPDQPAYTVQIDGVSHNVPQHGWWQRATYRRNAPAIIRTPAQIVAANRSFPFGNPGGPGVDARISAITAATPPYTGPFSSSNIGKHMQAGGGGSERWLITDQAAHFMRTGNPGPMLAWALCADSIPVGFTDETTGKPMDVVAHPLANVYGNRPVYNPWFAAGPKNAAGYCIYADGWTPSMDHYPSLSFTAYQATGDLGFLLNLQNVANFPSMSDPYFGATSGDAPIVGSGQTREIAWGLRVIFEAHVATKDAEAAGVKLADYDLLPSSYFKSLLNSNLAAYTKQMKDPRRQTFRLLGPPLGHIGQWQCDYLHMTLAFAVLTGHADWVPLFLWTLGNVVARTNGKSGWPVCYPAAYKFDTVLGGSALEGPAPGAPQFNWAQAFDNQVVEVEVKMTQADHDAILADPYHGGKLWPKMDYTSFMGCRFALIAADHVDRKGLAGIRATYPDFDVSLSNVERMFQNCTAGASERFCIIPATPIVIPRLP